MSNNIVRPITMTKGFPQFLCLLSQTLSYGDLAHLYESKQKVEINPLVSFLLF